MWICSLDIPAIPESRLMILACISLNFSLKLSSKSGNVVVVVVRRVSHSVWRKNTGTSPNRFYPGHVLRKTPFYNIASYHGYFLRCINLPLAIPPASSCYWVVYQYCVCMYIIVWLILLCISQTVLLNSKTDSLRDNLVISQLHVHVVRASPNRYGFNFM